MRFFSKETSDKLAALGCKASVPGFYYPKDYMISEYCYPPFSESRLFLSNVERAFTVSDFLDTTEHARKNCAILWGAEMVTDTQQIFPRYYEKQCAALKSHDAIAYIEEFLK